MTSLQKSHTRTILTRAARREWLTAIEKLLPATLAVERTAAGMKRHRRDQADGAACHYAQTPNVGSPQIGGTRT
jgi:hypothetical protein